jgi:hypothetical protein
MKLYFAVVAATGFLNMTRWHAIKNNNNNVERRTRPTMPALSGVCKSSAKTHLLKNNGKPGPKSCLKCLQGE